MVKTYPHASFLRNMKGFPKHWFKHYNQDNAFYNAKDYYHTLSYTDGLTGVYHVFYNGRTLKVFDTKKEAIKYTKAYMKKH